MTVITNRTWLPVASALSDFWANGDGPSETNTKLALGAAGIESNDIKGKNKREIVANAITSSPLATKPKVVTELVDLLAGEQHFSQGESWYQPKKVSKLEDALEDVGGSLLVDGTLTWEGKVPAPDQELLSQRHLRETHLFPSPAP
jgi:hypothetical protein